MNAINQEARRRIASIEAEIEAARAQHLADRLETEKKMEEIRKQIEKARHDIDVVFNALGEVVNVTLAIGWHLSQSGNQITVCCLFC